jgi:protein phosphatase
MTVALRVGSATDVGRVRSANEDSHAVVDDLGLFVVADGMGGHQAGEVASAAAVHTMVDGVRDGRALDAAVAEANTEVFERASADPALRGMGTTITAARLGADDTLVVAHVGDSRAYLWRDGELTQITVDHSLVAELVEAGALTEEEAERDPRRSMITRALGIEAEVEVDVYTVALQPGDRVLLCSDGLTTMVPAGLLADTLATEADPATAAALLVDAANAAGGTDNITVVIADVVEATLDPTLEAGDAPADPARDDTQEVPVVTADGTPPEAAPRRRRFRRRRARLDDGAAG